MSQKVGVGGTGPTAAVRLDGVVRTIGGAPVLDIDSLEIAPGERVAVIGSNGAGKTTLLRLLSGFIRPQRGVVSVLGRELTVPRTHAEIRALRAEVGQVMQGLHLVQRFSALENVLVGGLGRAAGWRSWLRLPQSEALDEAEAALREVGLLAKADVRADRLSGGERQRVAIARMRMQRARLVLADEPTAALDPLAAAEVCRLLRRSADGATLLTVVHSPALLPLLADRVIGLRHGRIAFDLAVERVDDDTLQTLYRGGAEDARNRMLMLPTGTDCRTVPA